ncbi:MAG: hypothetical protein QM767_21800 [Anaeromyxobacter sp.]
MTVRPEPIDFASAWRPLRSGQAKPKGAAGPPGAFSGRGYRAWTALLLLAAAFPAAAQDVAPGSGGALRLSAEPPRLLLGAGAGAEVRIAAPPEVEELTLSASAGRLEGLRRLPGGGFTVRYRPPVERHPQVAILAALARGPRGPLDGWLALPLSGQGEARVPGRPGEEVALRIADATFGPARVGPDGLARLTVVVPPGVREGHHGFTPVDLSIPETPLLHAVIERTTVQADRREQVRFLAYVVAPHGAARRDDPPALEPTRGTAAVVAREPGAFEGTWTLPPGPSGEDRLTVRLPGLAASRVVLRLSSLPGPPATVAIAFDRSAAAAGGEPVTVTARALDAAGNATEAALELASDGGLLAPPVEAGPGAISARVAAPERLAGRHSLEVRAWTAAGAVASARALPLEPGPAAEARVAPGADVLQADGAGEVAFTIRVRDRYGNPVAERPAVSAERGKVRGLEPAGADAWRVRYRAPAVAARTPERLVAEVGGARGQADLLLAPPPRGLSLLLSGGAAAETGGGPSGPWLGVTADAALPGAGMPWPQQVSVAVRFEAAGLELDRGDRRLLALLAGGELRRELRHGPELWLAGTAGLAWDRSGAGDGWAPAARLALGAGWPGRRITPYLEAGLLASGQTPGGGLTSVQVTAGLRLDLGAWTWRPSSSSMTSR